MVGVFDSWCYYFMVSAFGTNTTHSRIETTTGLRRKTKIQNVVSLGRAYTKYDAQRTIFDELRGISPGDETVCGMLDITS